MTYDTLWIGCSFSAGVYNKDNEILDKHQGIPNRLAQELSQKWKILTFPANGVHMFMQAIKVLDDKNLLSKFRNIIVQQTYEPRLEFLEHKAYQKIFIDVLDYIQNESFNQTFSTNDQIGQRRFSIIARQFIEMHIKRFKQDKLEFANLADEIAECVDPRHKDIDHYCVWADAALDYIKLVAGKNGCNFYTFKWATTYFNAPKVFMQVPKGLFRGLTDMQNIIHENNLDSYLSSPGDHPTQKIVDFASQVLKKELLELGYK